MRYTASLVAIIFSLAGFATANDTSVKCETCQFLAGNLLRDLAAREKNIDKKKKGSRSLVLSELLDSSKACEYNPWMINSEKSYGSHAADLFVSTCNLFMSEQEEILDDYLSSTKTAKEFRPFATKLCLETKACSALWKDDDLPERRESKAERNLRLAKEFLDKKAAESGVIKTGSKSGLLYKILTKGKGKLKPAATDKVKVHYRGTLTDGTEFDSSYSRNEPTEFFLNQVIKGWTEGLQLMSVGDAFEFYIPPDIAYGTGGSGKIPANAALIFKVELLEIIGKKDEL